MSEATTGSGAGTAIVTGAGQGFGRGIAAALAAAGYTVVAVGRSPDPLSALRAQLGAAIVPVVADAADPTVAARLIAEYEPGMVILNAGATPLTVPLQEQTWESFSRPWDIDVRQTFNWAREALLRPLKPGSLVVAMSSGAAIAGSPLSGGYAGAKATVRFIARYAAVEAARQSLGVRFVGVLPGLSPATAIGAAGARAYAARQGVTTETFVAGLGPTLTPAMVGDALAGLAAGAAQNHDAYRLTPSGLQPLE
jgi:NAD(P)-dependent dehydrogenase (short-subunit alcohol dehydrogenase family)